MKVRHSFGQRGLAVRAIIAAAIVAICIGLAGIGTPQSADAIDNGSLGIRPSNEADFFHLVVVPGDSVKATAIVSNHLSRPVVLETYVVDGLTSPSGAFALNAKSASRVGVGLWSHMNATQITVPARSEQAVPFTLTVPAGSKPGDYAGGLIIQSAAVPGATTDSNNTSVRIDIVQRQGVRIYLNVPGKTVTSLTVQPLSWVLHDSQVELTVTVTNTGNITLHPTATIGVNRWFGSTSTMRLTSPESVPPGATVTIRGKYPADAWAQLATASTVVTSDAGRKTSATDIFVLSTQLIGALSLVLALILVASWRIVRYVRRARSAFVLVAQAGESGRGRRRTAR